MSSPFSKIFSSKNPIRNNTTGGGYDAEMHKVASVPDKHATNITGTYDKAYDEYTNKHGYVDPDEFDKMQQSKAPTKMSPLEQGGYEGGGDIGAAYIPTAHMYTDMFAKIGQAAIDIDARNKKKKQDDKFKEQYGNETWYGDTDNQEYKKAYASHYGVQVPTYKKEK